LLGAVEQRLAPSGLTKLSVLVPDDQVNVGVLTRAGFLDKKHLRYFEREIPVRSTELTALKSWAAESRAVTCGPRLRE
jgi:hypothetical protein